MRDEARADLIKDMALTLETITAEQLPEVDAVLADWQHDATAVQLHSGDLGWHCRFGSTALAKAIRVWRRGSTIVTVGMVDEDEPMIRMAVAPEIDGDLVAADALVADLSDPALGVLPGRGGSVEARFGSALRERLTAAGWHPGESWTPLVLSLTKAVVVEGLRIENLDRTAPVEQMLRDRIAVQRAAFDNSTMTVEKWWAMAEAPAYSRARCLVGYDEAGHPVAAATVWSAGEGRRGLIEPLGAHRDHRGHGYGRIITQAAAAALQEMGSSSIAVCTPTANTGGVAAYVSAGFSQLAGVTDFLRPVV